jgi:oligopeptide transport system ATP-binding protein
MTEEKKNLETLEDLKTVDYSKKVLVVKNLKKYFFVGSGKNRLTIPAVDNISFDVYKREVFGLVGESGCGKTTAARTIIRLYTPTEGTVDLNGIRIGAGYLGFKREIKKIKAATNEKIIALDKAKYAISQLEKERNGIIANLKLEIANLNKERQAEIKAINKEVNDIKDAKYKLHNQFVLAVDNVYHKLKLQISDIKKLTKNAVLLEYQNQKKICQLTFERKRDGLKDSAALPKEEIAKRIDELHDQYVVQMNELKVKFEPLIAAEESKLLPKNEAKAQIESLKAEAKKQIEEIKAQYILDQEKIPNPDLEEIKEKLAKVNEKYVLLIGDKQAQINKCIEEYKIKIDAVPEDNYTPEQKEAIKEEAYRIKAEADAQIKVIKAKIAEAKEVNRSKDSMLAAQKMQMIFQDPISSLNPRMTVREIIGEGLAIQKKYSQGEINKRVGEALKLVGLLPEYASRYPHEFSGGQRQRIGIARALIMNPDFIIADEPISALDVSIRAQVINLLTNLKEQLGLTILFIAHDLSVVRFFCDRIAVMYYGKMVELATSEELFANPMHPYTISLLSAIPQPDPDYEKGRKRIHYNPAQHDYRVDKPQFREIAPGHFVLANDQEFAQMQKKYAENNKK